MSINGFDAATQKEIQKLVTRVNPESPGLTETSAYQIAAYLEKQGYRVDLALLDPKKPQKGYALHTDEPPVLKLAEGEEPGMLAHHKNKTWAAEAPNAGDRLGGQAKPTGKASEL